MHWLFCLRVMVSECDKKRRNRDARETERSTRDLPAWNELSKVRDSPRRRVRGMVDGDQAGVDW